jgi:hypothetical protein
LGLTPALSSNFYNHPRDGSEKDPTIHVLLLLSELAFPAEDVVLKM